MLAVTIPAMAGVLTKPRSNLFRSFLYLNTDEVVNTLSAIEGGDADEVLTRIAEERTGDIGGELGIGPAKGRAGKKRAHRLEEEVLRRRTEYSAASALLRLLQEHDAIGRLEGPYDAAVYEQLEEQILLQFRAQVRIHPLHQMISAGRAFLAAAKSFGVTPADLRDVRATVDLFEAMAQPPAGDRRTFLIFAETHSEQSDHKLVLPVHERFVRVELDDFAGAATFVAQVDRILGPDEELLALRLIRNAPQLQLEREGIVEALPDLIAAFDELGIRTDISDFVLRRPTVVLKPIMIFK